MPCWDLKKARRTRRRLDPLYEQAADGGLGLDHRTDFSVQRYVFGQSYTRGEGVSGLDQANEELSPAEAGRVVTAITTSFDRGELELSERSKAPVPGWASMPEVAVAAALREAAISPSQLRCFITFVAAMDRARDADALWRSAEKVWAQSPWVFDPTTVRTRSFTELAEVLSAGQVSQRHLQDVAAWRTIAESLADRAAAPEVHAAVFDGYGNARRLLDVIKFKTPESEKTSRFPFLAGPKVGPMWIRMLAEPGGARIDEVHFLPVAVDVQVRKVTENLGVARTQGQDLELVRSQIQHRWQDAVDNGTAVGPKQLHGTAAALDPVLWFWGKWGCSFCERAGRRMPIHDVCAGCRAG